MKKIITTLLVISQIFIIVFTPIEISANTYSNGDVIGEAKYTDIKTYIDGFQIRAYNVNDKMAISADDLRWFGFTVSYVDSIRTLCIAKGENAIDQRFYVHGRTYPVDEYWKNIRDIPSYAWGKKCCDIVYSDIVVKYYADTHLLTHRYFYEDPTSYECAKTINSFATNGESLIYLTDLSYFGNITFDEVERKAYFESYDGKSLYTSEELTSANSQSSYTPSYSYSSTSAFDLLKNDIIRKGSKFDDGTYGYSGTAGDDTSIFISYNPSENHITFLNWYASEQQNEISLLLTIYPNSDYFEYILQFDDMFGAGKMSKSQFTNNTAYISCDAMSNVPSYMSATFNKGVAPNIQLVLLAAEYIFIDNNFSVSINELGFSNFKI